MMKDNKFSGHLFLWFLLISVLFIFINPVSMAAEKYVVVDIDLDESAYQSDNLMRITNIRPEYGNTFYSLFQTIPEDAYFIFDNKIRLTDPEGNILIEGIASSPWIGPYFPDTSELTLLDESGNEILKRKISFCDNDGICEPCTDPDCESSENSFSCADCETGGADSFCDLEPDGKCDPDCEGIDADCTACTPYCFYKENEDFSCRTLKGKICSTDQICLGGEFKYSEDSPEYCCIAGTCTDPAEYVATVAAMQIQPSMTITPSGEIASNVIEEGADQYCVKELGGQLCLQGQQCQGLQKEYYLGIECCIGKCTSIPEEAKTIDKFPAIYDSLDYRYYQDPIISPETTDKTESRIAAGQESVEDAAADAEEPAEVDEHITIQETGIFERIKKLDPIKSTSILLVFVLIIIIILALLRRGPPKDEEQKQKDLQQDINKLVSEGNDYKQIRQILITKGNNPIYTDDEIRRNYQIRKGARQQ